MTTHTTSDLFERFQQRLEAAGGEAHYAESLAKAADIIAAHPSLARGEIVAPPAFDSHQHWGALLPMLAERGITVREAGDAASVADSPAGLSGAELVIAETGSILLADNALETRIVSMLTLTHFALAQASKLYPMLEDAGSALQQLTLPGPQQQRYISLVTGPSRTADIERTLTIGVQGPGALCVIIVAEDNSMDKTTFLNTLTASRAQWETLLAQIDEKEMLQPGVTGKWSVKDVIAHIMWNELEMLPLMQLHALVGSELWDLSEDERNEAVYQQYRDRPLQDIITEEQQAYARLLATAQTLSDEDLNDPHRFKDMPVDWIPWQIMAGCSFKHYQDHASDIREWLAHINNP